MLVHSAWPGPCIGLTDKHFRPRRARQPEHVSSVGGVLRGDDAGVATVASRPDPTASCRLGIAHVSDREIDATGLTITHRQAQAATMYQAFGATSRAQRYRSVCAARTVNRSQLQGTQNVSDQFNIQETRRGGLRSGKGK